jgi:hypothetical protein
MELIQLQLRRLSLQQRMPGMSTYLPDFGRWQCEMVELQLDIADYTLRNARALQD